MWFYASITCSHDVVPLIFVCVSIALAWLHASIFTQLVAVGTASARMSFSSVLHISFLQFGTTLICRIVCIGSMLLPCIFWPKVFPAI
uniref:Uncharacterized protein n=1 Tax=Arundo donax TaxID=35708 RepID=A0A0A9F856_ARUDO